MNISKITSAVIASMLMTAAVSCDKGSGNNSIPNPDTYSEVCEDKIEDAAIAKKVTSVEFPITEDYYGFVRKIEKFSTKLATETLSKSDGNTAISPLSVFTALGMAAECSDGNTREEILNALGVSYDELSKNIGCLCSECNKYFDDRLSKNQIKCVNSLWVKDGVKVKDECLKALTENYRSDVFKMDFLNTNVNEIVTAYIKNETNGFLSPHMELTPETLVMLMNVVYLRDVWNEFGGDLSFTKATYDFVCADGSKNTVKLLEGEYYNGKAVVTEKYRKFYTRTDGGLCLTFFVPNDGCTLDDIYTEETLNDKTIYFYEDEENRYHTRCLFPEFTADFDKEIQDVLKKLGVRDFFNKSACDFSRLTYEPVFCSKVKHTAKLNVQKSGIEGAAVTYMAMEGAAMPEPKKDVYEDFVIDRNFAYILSDHTGVPLFTGTVITVK